MIIFVLMLFMLRHNIQYNGRTLLKDTDASKPIYEGQMRYHAGSFSIWKVHKFRVDDHKLTWNKKEIDLNHIIKSSYSEGEIKSWVPEGYKWRFQFQTQVGGREKTHYFQCKTDGERQEWITYLKLTDATPEESDDTIASDSSAIQVAGASCPSDDTIASVSSVNQMAVASGPSHYETIIVDKTSRFDDLNGVQLLKQIVRHASESFPIQNSDANQPTIFFHGASPNLADHVTDPDTFDWRNTELWTVALTNKNPDNINWCGLYGDEGWIIIFQFNPNERSQTVKKKKFNAQLPANLKNST
eukprot:503172_1